MPAGAKPLGFFLVRSDARLAVILLLVLAGAPRASAQTAGAATGNIDGTVRDATGAVLPGVTIVVSGDALMGRKTSTSGPDGTYRLIGIPPGTYTLEFSLRGFRSGTLTNITLAIGATGTVHLTLDQVAVEESVVVEGGVLTVDRHATTLTTSFTARELAELPGSRNPSAILWATPSVMFTRVDVGGNIPDSQFSAYGTTGLTAPILGAQPRERSFVPFAHLPADRVLERRHRFIDFRPIETFLGAVAPCAKARPGSD